MRKAISKRLKALSRASVGGARIDESFQVLCPMRRLLIAVNKTILPDSERRRREKSGRASHFVRGPRKRIDNRRTV